MKIRVFTSITKLAFAILLLFSVQASAQWSGTYGNGWIDYSKPHFRIGIKTKGLHKIPFSIISDDFETAAAGNYQLFHRGEQVNIIVEGDGIVFYGEPNDGESDKWLFRPGPEARVNPYVSFFSDEGSYILTYGQNGKRMTPAVDGTAYSGDAQPYHFQKFVRAYNDQFNYSTIILENSENLNNCFYQKHNTYVSPTLRGVSTLDETITLTNWANEADELPTLEVMMHGNGYGNHNFDFSVGKTNADGDHGTVLQTLSFTGISAGKTPVFAIPAASLNPTGGVFRTKSKVAGDYTAQTYYILTYPQLSTMSGLTSLFMNYKASSDASPPTIHIGIQNAEQDLKLYNITDPHNPRVVSGSLVNGTFHAAVSRAQNEELKLLAARPSAISIVTAEMLSAAEIQPRSLYVNENNVRDANATTAIDPAAYDYLIVTSEPFSTKYKPTGEVETLGKADEYALYRSSNAGGAYKVAVFEIKSLYNQFNYGEPSPVAIKRFVDYMVSKGVRFKHNLLLIGNSVTAPDIPSVPRLKKEMPLEVPSIGDPASDFLLVAGIHDLGEDIPAIPVGRIPVLAAPSGGGVVNPDEVTYYLSKVKKYESATGDLSWRRNLIHLDGSKHGETFGRTFLDPLIPIARTLDATRPIETLGKDPADSSPRPANITSQVNSGTGMLTYYGHGGYNFTQLNIGMLTKSNPYIFTNEGGTYDANQMGDKFPFVYFNGCGVGNAFTSRNPVSTALASDWILADGKGAIAVIASSFNSFATPTGSYLKELYKEIFTKTDGERKTIGQIKNVVANNIISGNFNRRTLATPDDYDRNNLHIANLFGDPAVRILATAQQNPLPLEFSFINATPEGKKNITVFWKTAWEKENSHFVVQRSNNGIDFTDIGVVDGKGTVSEQTAYNFKDVSPVLGINYYRVGQVDIGATEPQKYSRTVAVEWRSDELVIISPNPVSNFAEINLDGLYKLKVWKLYDINGKKIKQGLTKKISLEGLSQGDYIIEMEMSNDEVYTRKVVKY